MNLCESSAGHINLYHINFYRANVTMLKMLKRINKDCINFTKWPTILTNSYKSDICIKMSLTVFIFFFLFFSFELPSS